MVEIVTESRAMTAPIIVFGAPRSGTTYLQRLLNQHPEVYVSHETRVFAWLHAATFGLTAQDQYVVTMRDEFREHLTRELPDLLRRFYAELAPGKRYWGDKNPHYADPANRGCLQTVADLFPGARFVNIVRDGRDVVASLLRRRHRDGTPWVDFDSAHHTWVRHVEIGREFGEQHPSSYLELRYEELVADDLEHSRRLFGFLDIPFHPSVEAFCLAQAERRTPFSSPTRDLGDDASGSDWGSMLSAEEQTRSIELLGPTLHATGYEPSAAALTGSPVVGPAGTA